MALRAIRYPSWFCFVMVRCVDAKVTDGSESHPYPGGMTGHTGFPCGAPVAPLSPVPMTADPPAPGNPHRFAHIDTLRALSALMVACAHLSERFRSFVRDPGAASFLGDAPRLLNFGRLGVLLFFAISGFVIYASLRGPGTGVGRRFVITRFFRLYPAYWLSLALGLFIFWLCRGQTFRPYLVLANATMLPRLLHAPLVLGVYWTLETELVFYAGCWALWRAGSLENRRVLVGLIVGLCAAWWVVRALIHAHALPDNLPAPWKAMPRHLALMFWGAFFRVLYEDTRGFREHWRNNRQVWLLGGLGLLLMLMDGPKAFRITWGPHPVMPSAYAVAPLFFALWVAVWRVRWGLLASLGRISYSFYLFHLVVAVPLVTFLALTQNAAWRGWPLGVYMGIALTLTIGLSAVIFYAVERPSIALGKRLSARPVLPS